MADAKPEFTSDASKADDAAEAAAQRKAIRKKWLVRLALAVLILGAVYALWYLLIGRNHVSTDNAYVNADVAQVTPLISAQAVEVLVTDTQAVRRGDILVKLDPTNARIAIAQAEADLAEARRRFRQAVATSGSSVSFGCSF